MADVHDKATRSYNRCRIKGSNTKPELLIRKFLFAHGFRYRLDVKDLPGKPDIVLPKKQNRDLCEWMLLAWTYGMPVFCTPQNTHERMVTKDVI